MFLLAALTEALAAVVITQGTGRAAWGLFLRIMPSKRGGTVREIRIQLGRWLALALEFLLAADILRTAVAPTWNDIGQLAAIVAIRTGLNYFLENEIRRESKDVDGSQHPS